MRIAVIGDIHSNTLALEGALDKVNALGYDHLVLLGDLFSYGLDPVEILNMVKELVDTQSTSLLMGNHDWLYARPEVETAEYFERLPDWIKESITWTRQQLSGLGQDELPWLERTTVEKVFFAHANASRFGDWGYLNTEEEVLGAAREIESLELSLGVFGHTHRQRISTVKDGEVVLQTSSSMLTEKNTTYVVNAGSPGQPRNRERQSCVLLIEHQSGGVKLDLVPFEYDRIAVREQISNSELSEQTKKKLVGYY